MPLRVFTLMLACAVAPAFAQSCPAPAIRLVQGATAGNAADIVARVLAPGLGVQLKVDVSIDASAGGAGAVASARPDGCTLLLHSMQKVLSVALGANTGYDLLRDLSPVALIASAPMALIVSSSVPAKTPAQFIAYLRTHPDGLSYATTGIDGLAQFATLLLLQRNALSAVPVPYHSATFAMLDALAGRVQFSLQRLESVMPYARDGRIRVLAVTGLARSAHLPEVPTLAESAMPGFQTGDWYGVMAPAQTPPAIVSRLNAAITAVMKDAAVTGQLAVHYIVTTESTPEQYVDYLKSELARWSQVAKTAGVRRD
jgi:tripartite-type tricarboxylate transporter receptor subunit TctC